jgi:DNA modification methylase
MNKSIGVRILKTESINWRELQFIQENDFKEIPEEAKHKLKASLVSNNFVQPFYVWEDTNGIIFCLDGKHRSIFLEELINDGFDIPLLLPATFVDCADKKEAAKLVLVFSSAYAKVTQTGFNNFITLNDLDWTELKSQIDLPDFSNDRFEQKFDVHGIKENGNDEDEEFGIANLELIVKPGDLFQLGNHRLICGSFLDAEIVTKLMNDKLARIIFCDPPYNLPANFFTNKDEQRHKDFAMGAGEMSDKEFSEFLYQIMQISSKNSIAGGIHYICMDFRHMWHMTDAAFRCYGSYQPKQVCVWNKDIMANGSFYRAKQELVFVFQNSNAESLWNNDLIDEVGFYKNNQELVFIFKNGDGPKHLSHLDLADSIRTNVWNYPSAVSTANPDRYELKNHPTPKPVAMVADAILDTTNEGDIVVDWFVGSGTTIIAAEKTGRICHASEIEPMHIQHIICRYYRYCLKMGKEFTFKHINGSLTIDEILKLEAVA